MKQNRVITGAAGTGVGYVSKLMLTDDVAAGKNVMVVEWIGEYQYFTDYFHIPTLTSKDAESFFQLEIADNVDVVYLYHDLIIRDERFAAKVEELNSRGIEIVIISRCPDYFYENEYLSKFINEAHVVTLLRISAYDRPRIEKICGLAPGLLNSGSFGIEITRHAYYTDTKKRYKITLEHVAPEIVELFGGKE